MEKSERLKALQDIFQDIDGSEKELVDRLIHEVVFLEEQLDALRKLPFIAQNPKNPAQMKTTPAAKLYKETSQSYMNAVRILLSVLRKADDTEQNELLRRLEEFV